MERCRRCNAKIEQGWSFCPRCGSLQKGDFFSRPITEHLKRMRQEFAHMDKMFEKNFEMFDISPYFRKPTKAGFSIRISTTSGKKPQISVKTYGNVDKDKILDQVAHQLKQGRPLRFTIKPKPVQKKLPQSVAPHAAEPPKSLEEAKSSVKRQDNKVIVEVHMPHAHSLNEIEVKELENSVEVKFVKGDKAYFNIFTKPPHSRLVNKRLEKGILYLEFY